MKCVNPKCKFYGRELMSRDGRCQGCRRVLLPKRRNRGVQSLTVEKRALIDEIVKDAINRTKNEIENIDIQMEEYRKRKGDIEYRLNLIEESIKELRDKLNSLKALPDINTGEIKIVHKSEEKPDVRVLPKTEQKDIADKMEEIRRAEL